MIRFNGKILNVNIKPTGKDFLLTFLVIGCIVVGLAILVYQARTILAFTLSAYEGYRLVRYVLRRTRTYTK